MELEKEGKMKSAGDRKQYKTIVVMDPPDNLLDKELLTNHFSKFGTIVKSSVSKKNRHAIFSFTEPSAAKMAKEQGTVISANLPRLVIYYKQKDLESPTGRTLMPRPVMKRVATGAITAPKLPSLIPKIKANPTSLPVKRGVLNPSQPVPPAQSSGGETTIYAFYPDSPEAQELFTKRANSAEERYRLLEARDKLIRAKFPKVKMRVECAVKLAGTCRDMCPEKERYMREVQRQLQGFEMTEGKDGEVDHRLAIKAYARSSADQEEPLPHELRPTETLEMSMEYILHNIIPRQDSEDLANWYNFVWDRTRSIRKDITQQQLWDERAVALMEKCTRFHIHCSTRLCELDRHAFDAKLNDENLMKCLQSLEHMYTDLNLMGRACPNEPEFRAYQILMNLNEGDILWEIQQKPDRILRSPEVQFAIKIHMAMFEKNYAQFFYLVRRAPYLTACILHRYFFQVRSSALRTIFKAYYVPKSSSENYTSLSAVQRTLGFNQENPRQFEYFCNSHGIVCDFEKDRIVLNRKTFEMPESPLISREHELIDSKLDSAVNEILNRGKLEKNPYPDHCPHTSFDDQGFLIPGDLIGVPAKTGLKSGYSVKGITTSAPTASAAAAPAQLAGFSWAVPSAPIKSAPQSIVTGNIVKSEPSSSYPSFSATSFSSPFGGLSASGSSSSSPSSSSAFPGSSSSSGWIFGGGGQASTAVPPPATKPLIFPSFSAPPVPSPAVLREGKLKSVSETVLRSIADSAIRKLCEDCYLAERERREGELARQALLDKVATSVYARLEQSVIENEVRMFWVRRRQIQQLVESKGREICEALYRKVNMEKVRAISSSCYQEAVKEREAKLSKLKELTSRIRVRFWVAKWKAYTERKKTERERLLEEKIKELENFPAYQNTYLLSSEEILQSWCGGPIEDRRRKTLCSPTRFFNWQDNPKGSPPPTRIKDTKDQKEPVASRISDEQILRIVQLYDFPPSSNINNSSTASVLSSWLGVDVGANSSSRNQEEGNRELKRRRMDDEEF